jgi:hypothetical protein
MLSPPWAMLTPVPDGRVVFYSLCSLSKHHQAPLGPAVRGHARPRLPGQLRSSAHR